MQFSITRSFTVIIPLTVASIAEKSDVNKAPLRFRLLMDALFTDNVPLNDASTIDNVLTHKFVMQLVTVRSPIIASVDERVVTVAFCIIASVAEKLVAVSCGTTEDTAPVAPVAPVLPVAPVD